MTNLVMWFLGLSCVFLCQLPSWSADAQALQKINGGDVYRHSFDHEAIAFPLPPGKWLAEQVEYPKSKHLDHMYQASFVPEGDSKDFPNRLIRMITHLGSEQSAKDLLSENQKVYGLGNVNVIEEKSPNDILLELKAAGSRDSRESHVMERVIKARDGLHTILFIQMGTPVTPSERAAMIQFTKSVKLENK